MGCKHKDYRRMALFRKKFLLLIFGELKNPLFVDGVFAGVSES